MHSKENTMRVLKGQFPIQKLRCRMGWHRWTSWTIVNRAHANGFSDYPSYAECHCADCGMPRQERPYTKSIKQ
jgi:hypothetical protein